MKKLLLLSITVIFTSCVKDNLSPFCEAILANDVSYVRNHVDKIIDRLEPYPDSYDYTGHLSNLEFLVDQLNRDHCAFAQIICYACIETFPAQSEIEIEINDGGYYTYKVLDIATPYDSPMYFVGMHD